ncbi:unnamed protein product [Dibothriocephalus latus]|uniref:Uncharacterized protein n=1 Tax=Dibothriocephalus latus TaxID=60516 RepID=A0A3P7M838_DIBLA|nr:unnamed protein product [Dibothriocephalus latus]
MSSICDKAEERDCKEDESVARNPGVLPQSDEMDSCGRQETCNLAQSLPAQSDATEEESRAAEVSTIETPEMVVSTDETSVPPTAPTTTTCGTNYAAEEGSHCGDDCPSDGEASSNGSTSSTGSSSGSGSDSYTSSPKNNRNCRSRGFGVLSDISERTEETETTAPSSLMGQCERNSVSTLLDLALQQSRLVTAERDPEEIGGLAAWPSLPSEEIVFGSPPLSFLKLTGGAMTTENSTTVVTEPPPSTPTTGEGSHSKEAGFSNTKDPGDGAAVVKRVIVTSTSTIITIRAIGIERADPRVISITTTIAVMIGEMRTRCVPSATKNAAVRVNHVRVQLPTEEIVSIRVTKSGDTAICDLMTLRWEITGSKLGRKSKGTRERDCEVSSSSDRIYCHNSQHLHRALNPVDLATYYGLRLLLLQHSYPVSLLCAIDECLLPRPADSLDTFLLQ